MLTSQQAAVLKTDIENSPELSAYSATGNDQAICDWYNSARETALGLVDKADLHARLHEFAHASDRPVWMMILDAAANPLTPQALRDACGMIRESAVATYTKIDMSLPTVQAALNGLLAAGYLTQAQRDELDVLGAHTVTQAQHLLGEAVTLDLSDISFALRGTR